MRGAEFFASPPRCLSALQRTRTKPCEARASSRSPARDALPREGELKEACSASTSSLREPGVTLPLPLRGARRASSAASFFFRKHFLFALGFLHTEQSSALVMPSRCVQVTLRIVVTGGGEQRFVLWVRPANVRYYRAPCCG